MLRWFTTLKFKIVTVAVVTGVLSAVGTAQLVLITTRDDIQRLLMQADSDNSERTAALLATKMDMLQGTLTAVARQVRPVMWQDRVAMTQFLADKPAIGALFDSVFAARADGEMLARLIKSVPASDVFKRLRAIHAKALKATRHGA